MKKNEVEVNDRQQTLQPAQAAPMRRSDNVTSCQPAEAQNPLMGVEASVYPAPRTYPFAGDDAE